MTQQITIPKTEYEKLTKRVTVLEQNLRFLMENLRDKLDLEPPYGSDTWWGWADRKGLDAIKKGAYVEFPSVKELQIYLASLK